MRFYHFVINPKSGTGNAQQQRALIEKFFSGRAEKMAIHFTEYPGHAHELALELGKTKEDVIVCVGGDGSINEIARALMNKPATLGVIPVGSGNGLARHLGIPLKSILALEELVKDHSIAMDVGELNGHPFFVTAGIGFEAEVAYLFSKRSIRGILGYTSEAVKLFPQYRSKTYRISTPDGDRDTQAFSLTVANSSQYGNNAIIAKHASVMDGLLDLSIIHSYPKILGPQIGLSLMTNNLHQSKYYESEQITRVQIHGTEGEKKTHAHIDGDSVLLTYPLEAIIRPKCLNVIVPKNKIV
ncbi:YegS/Rv2252/BmrU family lipid kinase [bacterium SCSIO 12741]|nr:YegS/Rv2252/BmrU family lipid kinase [bacterium SCSIO 12741]